MKQYEEVDVAVWIAAAAMTYDIYRKQVKLYDGDINIYKFYIKQSDIRKKAKDICTKKIEPARTSYHYNADNSNNKNTYNYFREKNDLRRVTYAGELNGNREYPDEIQNILNDKVNTVDGEINIADILNFIKGEYKDCIVNNEKTGLRYILDFLYKYAKHIYRSPDKEIDPDKKREFENISYRGNKSVSILEEICQNFEDQDYKINSTSSWMVPKQESEVKHYLWIQIKNIKKMHLSSSISIFAENENGDVRFRVALEIKDKDSKEDDYIRHNRFLNYLNIDSEDFEYFGTRNKDINLKDLSKDSIKKYIQEVKERKANKIQIGKTIDYDYIKNNSADDVISIMKDTVNKLKKYYEIAVQEGDEIQVSATKYNNSPKNIILYGPPGTGKTYNVCNKALEIIDYEKYKDIINNPLKRDELVKEFNKLKEDGIIGFCTFHQSYSYEDFVEGLRSDGSGGFEPKGGIFKQLCESASVKAQTELPKYKFDQNQISVHKMSLGDTSSKEDTIYEYCIKNNCVSLGWGRDIDYTNCKDIYEVKEVFKQNNPDSVGKDFDINAINRFKNIIQEGDLVIISQGNHKARAIGKVIGDYNYDPNTEIRYNHFRKVEWLYNGEAIDVKGILKDKVFSQQSIYTFYNEDLKFDNIKELISEKPIENKSKNYVLIIDEINRGNISKIFGELITLIEEDKRIGERNELKVTLPYSNESFGVPNNLYIIGTMNTADRSIALLDTALRRRFDFVEYMPNEELLSTDAEGINVSKLLKTINDRIEFLIDREHTIGHAYFIKENLTFEDLVSIMKNKIIPLLQEYFYEDFEKIEMVLGGSGKAFNNNYLLNKTTIKASSLFKSNQTVMYPDKVKYSVVDHPSREAFIRIYDDPKDKASNNTNTLDGE